MGTNIYGELVRAQLQNSASDLTPSVSGLVYFNALEGVKWYSGSAWRTAADLNSQQVITNKDIDGGTASDTSRLTLPKGTTAALGGLTRKEGTLLFSTNEKVVLVDTGTELKTLGEPSFQLVTANVTAVSGDKILADTSAGSFTVTLPATPSVGFEIVIADPASYWSINDLAVARNGSNIDGVASDLTLDVSGSLVRLVYTGATQGWVTYVSA